MLSSEDRHPHFETDIKYPKVEIKLEEIEVNLLDFWQEPKLPNEGNNYFWDFDISIGSDRDAEEQYDILTTYINADMFMQGQQYFIIKVNTLHSYQISKLEYKKSHEELYKLIARESLRHSNEIIKKAAKGTAYEGFVMPELDEDWLEEDATEWNKRGYLPKAAKPDENPFGRKPSPAEMKAMSERSQELVDWIDAYNDNKREHSEEETREYWKNYAEWATLNKRLWHFKLIARNHLAYLMDKIMRGMERKMQDTPDNYDLQEIYDDMVANYQTFMNELKDEFAKN
jgi:hypothetical protein